MQALQVSAGVQSLWVGTISNKELFWIPRRLLSGVFGFFLP